MFCFSLISCFELSPHPANQITPFLLSPHTVVYVYTCIQLVLPVGVCILSLIGDKQFEGKCYLILVFLRSLWI